MLDLFLTDSGDLSFLTNMSSKSSEGFVYNFHIAQTDSLLFNFYIDNTNKKENNNCFEYSFYTYTPEYNKEMMTVSSKNYIQQCIKIRLNTELDTIRENTDMGCNLHTIIHSNIPNNKLKTKVEEMIKESIQDILPNASVSVSFLNTDYLNYHDSIRVVIVNNEDIYYYTV